MENRNEYPSISIIIPLYNAEPYISDCLLSVAAQSYGGTVECVVVDDCSTDRSREVVQDFINSYTGPIEFSMLSRIENGGQAAARNEGIRHSRGEYLLFLDSDDELLHSALSHLAEPLLNHRYDLVVGDYVTIGTSIPMTPLLLDEGAVGKEEIFSSYLKIQWFEMPWNKLCNRNFIIDNSLFFKPGLRHEDNLWSFQVAATASSMYVVHEKCYLYKVRSGSDTTSMNAGVSMDALQTIHGEFINFIDAKNLPVSTDLWNFIHYFSFQILLKTYRSRKAVDLATIYRKIRGHKLGNGRLRLRGVPLKLIIINIHFLLPASLSIRYLRTIFWISNRIGLDKNGATAANAEK